MTKEDSQELEKIKKVALHLLAQREHSRRELYNKLKLRNFNQTKIVEVLNNLKDLDLQSDTRFAESYLKMRTDRGYGPIRIALELQERGVASEIIGNIDPDHDFWCEQAKQVFFKKFSIPAKAFNERAKQIRFMQYRGFTGEQLKGIFGRE